MSPDSAALHPGYFWCATRDADTLNLDPASAHIHVLHGMTTSCLHLPPWMPPFVSATGSSSFFNSAFDKPVVSSATSRIGRFCL